MREAAPCSKGKKGGKLRQRTTKQSNKKINNSPASALAPAEMVAVSGMVDSTRRVPPTLRRSERPAGVGRPPPPTDDTLPPPPGQWWESMPKLQLSRCACRRCSPEGFPCFEGPAGCLHTRLQYASKRVVSVHHVRLVPSTGVWAAVRGEEPEVRPLLHSTAAPSVPSWGKAVRTALSSKCKARIFLTLHTPAYPLQTQDTYQSRKWIAEPYPGTSYLEGSQPPDTENRTAQDRPATPFDLDRAGCRSPLARAGY